MAAAGLQVLGSTCRLAGSLPGTSARSHSAYSCLGDRQGHVCCLQKGVDDVLRKALAVNLGLKNLGASRLQPPRFRASHASVGGQKPLFMRRLRPS